MHWGPDLRTAPSEDFRRFAHAAIDRGVDVIHGHSAHVVQAIERYGRGVILYDTGNFIDDYWKIPFRRTTWSFVFGLTVENGRPVRLELVPVLTHPSPTIATGKVFQAIAETMRSQCAAFGTTIVETASGLEIPLR
jgi:poly-gamma-glutamate synthesis protein (capsule biosynthesis protein)